MRIDHPECGFLFAQVQKHANEERVLDDIGKITGVKGVAVVHGIKDRRANTRKV